MKITILGTGAYAMALANMFNYNNNDITLWSKFEEEIKYIKDNNKIKVLPNITLPNNYKYTTNLKEAVNNSNLIVIAVPAVAVNDVCISLSEYYKGYMHICIATKGIEQNTGYFMNDIVEKYIKTNNIAVISGGTFAIDMFDNPLIGLTLATKNKETENIIKKCLESKHLKIRITNDILGIEICGAIKNVFAIASGILDGLGYNSSTNSMFIVESLINIKKIITELNGNEDTIISYAGIGDLLLTCNSSKSRNYTLGKMIGRKANKEEIDNYIKNTTIEGLYTLKSIHMLLKEKNIDIPLINVIYDIIYNNKDCLNLIDYITIKE